MERHGIQLLVLSHVYQVRELKRACEAGLAGKLTAENVVDVLQLARECDAPYLSIRCMKFISKDFKKVEKTEGWRFLQDHDPWLELHILQFMDEAELVSIHSIPISNSRPFIRLILFIFGFLVKPLKIKALP